jgi:hypothetical protein
MANNTYKVQFCFWEIGARRPKMIRFLKHKLIVLINFSCVQIEYASLGRAVVKSCFMADIMMSVAKLALHPNLTQHPLMGAVQACGVQEKD